MVLVHIMVARDDKKRFSGDFGFSSDFIEPFACSFKFARPPMISDITGHQDRIKTRSTIFAQIIKQSCPDFIVPIILCASVIGNEMEVREMEKGQHVLSQARFGAKWWRKCCTQA